MFTYNRARTTATVRPYHAHISVMMDDIVRDLPTAELTDGTKWPVCG
jgi:hypothetical protein